MNCAALLLEGKTSNNHLINGSIAYDILLGYEGDFRTAIDQTSLDALSVNYPVPHYKKTHGGTAANIAIALRALDETSSIVSAIGHDGEEYLDLLQQYNVNTRYVQKERNAVTATAMIATDMDNRQISFFHPGADGIAHFPTIDEHYDLAIFSPRNPLTYHEGVEQVVQKKIPFIFDPGQVIHAFSSDELRAFMQLSVCTVMNEYEYELMQKITGCTSAAVQSLCSFVVITLGEKGLVIKKGNEECTIQAVQGIDVINPTGAGDALRAGLMYGMSRNWSLEHIGTLCSVMGSFAVEQEGTLLLGLTKEKIVERIIKAMSA
jgi:adenosine kinase